MSAAPFCLHQRLRQSKNSSITHTSTIITMSHGGAQISPIMSAMSGTSTTIAMAASLLPREHLRSLARRRHKTERILKKGIISPPFVLIYYYVC